VGCDIHVCNSDRVSAVTELLLLPACASKPESTHVGFVQLFLFEKVYECLLRVQARTKKSLPWFVHDERPRRRVPAQYVPQLQLEMLASGLRSSVFVSRSAEHGTNIFRVARDDTYCATMLSCISHFYTQHVVPKRVPGRNYCMSWPCWRRFCQRTGELSATARLLHHLPPDECPLGQSQPLFL
jgi:hypothetical protein